MCTWIRARVLGFASLLFLASGCNKPGASLSATNVSAAPATPPSVRFTEVAEASGIRFTYVNGARGRKLMPETVGSGLAFFDYDSDGDPDLLVMNGRTWEGDKNPILSTPHLYQNNGKGQFTDVTQKAGLAVSLYGMGACPGDFDNDGDQDLYLTAVGPNFLFENDGKGHFTNITQKAGVVGVPLPGTEMRHKWSSGAAWVDYDKDGKLDLFVCQYVKWSPELDPFCGHNGRRGYCPPDNFEGARCTLFRSEGGGRFRDVSRETGLFDGAVGKSFGTGIADWNNDGWPDIAVTNDTWANFLFINEGGKRFREAGVESGIAFGAGGHPKAGMGIDVADFRNNGRFGLVVGNFTSEGLSLFEPLVETQTAGGDQPAPEGGSPIVFSDVAHKDGVVTPALLNVTFATFFFDFDLDGWQDIFATNGHVDDIVSTYQSNLTFKQKPLLLRNKTGTGFEPVQNSGLDRQIVGRGAACADIDGDGDLDVGVLDNAGKFLLFRGDGAEGQNYLRVRVEGTRSNRDGIGTVVRVTSGGVTQSQIVRSGGSFLSESERVLTFGLGKNQTVDAVEVRWPSGTVDKAGSLPVRAAYLVVEGKGVQR